MNKCQLLKVQQTHHKREMKSSGAPWSCCQNTFVQKFMMTTLNDHQTHLRVPWRRRHWLYMFTAVLLISLNQVLWQVRWRSSIKLHNGNRWISWCPTFVVPGPMRLCWLSWRFLIQSNTYQRQNRCWNDYVCSMQDVNKTMENDEVCLENLMLLSSCCLCFAAQNQNVRGNS